MPVRSLEPAELLALRLQSQLLDERTARTPGQVVEWFGAMQAQDLASGEWSFGVRARGLTRDEVDRATLERRILRTWPMRGTVHFVPPRDARWMLEVTGSRALAGAAGRRERLGLNEAIVHAATELLRDELRGGGCRTRAECVQLLVDAGLHTAPEHGYHLLWYASQVGVTCMGPQRGKEQTFVLLDEWVPDARSLDRDGALAELARRFVRSHGPVTAQDLARWTGLTLGDSRRGIDLVGDELCPVRVGDVDMVVRAAQLVGDPPARAGVLLLPGFDEYVLGYKDRSAMLTPAEFERVVPGGNGVFRPTLVVDGRVRGTWARTVRARHVQLTVTPFAPLSARARSAMERAAADYGAFLGLEARVQVADP